MSKGENAGNHSIFTFYDTVFKTFKSKKKLFEPNLFSLFQVMSILTSPKMGLNSLPHSPEF